MCCTIVIGRYMLIGSKRKSHFPKKRIRLTRLNTKYVEHVSSLEEALNKLHFMLLALKSRYKVQFFTMEPKKYSNFLLMIELYRNIVKFLRVNYKLHRDLEREMSIDLAKIDVIRRSLKDREERRVLVEEVKELTNMVEELLEHLENYYLFVQAN